MQAGAESRKAAARAEAASRAPPSPSSVVWRRLRWLVLVAAAVLVVVGWTDSHADNVREWEHAALQDRFRGPAKGGGAAGAAGGRGAPPPHGVLRGGSEPAAGAQPGPPAADAAAAAWESPDRAMGTRAQRLSQLLWGPDAPGDSEEGEGGSTGQLSESEMRQVIVDDATGVKTPFKIGGESPPPPPPFLSSSSSSSSAAGDWESAVGGERGSTSAGGEAEGGSPSPLSPPSSSAGLLTPSSSAGAPAASSSSSSSGRRIGRSTGAAGRLNKQKDKARAPRKMVGWALERAPDDLIGVTPATVDLNDRFRAAVRRMLEERAADGTRVSATVRGEGDGSDGDREDNSGGLWGLAARALAVWRGAGTSKRVRNYCKEVAVAQAAERAKGRNPGEGRELFSEYKKGILAFRLLLDRGWHDQTPKQRFNGNPLTKASPLTGMFFLKATESHIRNKMEVGFPCPGQVYNHIPGDETLGRKDEQLDTMRRYEARIAAAGTPAPGQRACFDLERFHPPSYRLDHADECHSFFGRLSGLADERRRRVAAGEKVPSVNWITKVSRHSHNGSGIKLLSEEGLGELRRKYGDGKRCGKIKDPKLVQHYINNPLLLRGHKVDLRIYLFVASTNPLVAFYHRGFLRKAMQEYDPQSTSFAAHVTNTQVAKKMKGFSSNSTLHASQMMTLDQLQGALLDEKITEREDWVSGVLEPAMREHMVHVINSADFKFAKQEGLFSVYGFDFMIDSDLHVWYIEANRSPAYQGTTPRKKALLISMLNEVYEVEEALLRGGFAELANVKLRGMQPLMLRRYRNDGDLVVPRGATEYFGNVPAHCGPLLDSAVAQSLGGAADGGEVVDEEG